MCLDQRDEWPDSFGKLAALGSGTPAGFSIGDLDGDGRIEVATIQPHGNDPYVAGTRDEVLYRWEGEAFVEVATEPQPRPGEPALMTPNVPRAGIPVMRSSMSVRDPGATFVKAPDSPSSCPMAYRLRPRT